MARCTLRQAVDMGCVRCAALSTTACSTRCGWACASAKVTMPPYEAPRLARNRAMPSRSIKATSSRAWSKALTDGNTWPTSGPVLR